MHCNQHVIGTNNQENIKMKLEPRAPAELPDLFCFCCLLKQRGCWKVFFSSNYFEEKLEWHLFFYFDWGFEISLKFLEDNLRKMKGKKRLLILFNWKTWSRSLCYRPCNSHLWSNTPTPALSLLSNICLLCLKLALWY